MNSVGFRRCSVLLPSPRLHAACLGHHQPRPARLTRALHDDASEEKSLSKRLNPPISTRPPPLARPTRDPSEIRIKHLINVGKAFLTFYKDGLKAVFSNRRLLKELLAPLAPEERPSLLWPRNMPLRALSRADYVTFWRVRHDTLRIPLFGIILVVCGEFTPFVVLLFEGAVPLTCRIPDQISRSLRTSETRRADAFEELEARFPQGPYAPGLTVSDARAHVLRSLHLSGSVWDRVGFTPPGLWLAKGALYMEYLEGDDKKLLEDGAPIGLSREELRTACAERGIDVIDKSETELRGWLGDWLRLTAAEDDGERKRRIATLLLTRAENWPRAANFALPDVTL